eukprot:2306957-Rhodomonas_salina.1
MGQGVDGVRRSQRRRRKPRSQGTYASHCPNALRGTSASYLPTSTDTNRNIRVPCALSSCARLTPCPALTQRVTCCRCSVARCSGLTPEPSRTAPPSTALSYAKSGTDVVHAATQRTELGYAACDMGYWARVRCCAVCDTK